MSRRFLICCLVSLLGVVMTSANADPRYREHDRRLNTSTIYTTTNAADGNSVLAFRRNSDGRLTPSGTFATGGKGAGTGLGSQGAVAVDVYGRWLLTVNAGSDTLSFFSISGNRLQLRDVVPSGGRRPVSVSIDRNTVYVLNADTDSVTGFRIVEKSLVPIPDSTHHLSRSGSAPAQTQFSPDGETLVVTEKATNTIDVFPVMNDGQLGDLLMFPSATPTPFGFAFGSHATLLVSEAAGGATNASTLSSYRLGEHGGLKPVSPSVPTNQSAACWVAVSRDGQFAFTTNTGSGSVSTFALSRSGKLFWQENTPVGTAPIDMTVSGNYLYVLNSGSHDIVGLLISRDGTLTAIGDAVTVPTGTNGLAGL